MDLENEVDVSTTTTTNTTTTSSSTTTLATESSSDEATSPVLSSDADHTRTRYQHRRAHWIAGIPKPDVIRKAVKSSFKPSDAQTKTIPDIMIMSLQNLSLTFSHIAEPNVVNLTSPTSSSMASDSECAAGAAATSEAVASEAMQTDGSACLKVRSKLSAGGGGAGASAANLQIDSLISLASKSGPGHIDHNKWRVDLLRSMEESLTLPQFYLHGSYGVRLEQRELLGHIANREFDLPVFDVTVMQEQLQEAGTFSHNSIPFGEKRTFPPCANGVKCVGTTGIYKWKGPPKHGCERGFVFTSLMYPHELQSLLKSSLRPPVRPCVPCCIRNLTEYILVERAMRMNCDEEAAAYAETIKPSTQASSSAASAAVDSRSTSTTTSPSLSSSSSSSSSSYTTIDDASLVFGRAAAEQRFYQLFRNPVDCPGGFHRAYTLCDPDAVDVFIDPIVRLCASTCYFQQCPNGRACLDISMMAWKPKQSLALTTGIQLSKYIKNSRAEIVGVPRYENATESKTRIQYIHELCIATTKQAAYSRKNTKVLQVFNPTTRCFRMSHARMAMLDPTIDPMYSLMSTLVVDAFRLSGATSANWHAPMSVWHMPCTQQRVFSVAFCTQMDQRDALVCLLSKTVPERCNTRKFGGVALAMFATHPNACYMVKLLVLNSLLGNYPHSNPETRPPSSTRAYLYRVLMDENREPRNQMWFETLISVCPYLVEFCLRDLIVFHMHDDPAFANHIALLLNVDHFYVIMSKCLDFIRRRVHVLIELKTGIRLLSLEMQAALKPFHCTLLQISYRVPKTMADMLSKLTSVRDGNQSAKKEVVQVSIPSNTGGGGTADADAEEEAYIDRIIEEQLATLSFFKKHNMTDPTQKLTDATTNEDDASKTKVTNIVMPTAAKMIGEETLARLRYFIQRVASSRRDALQKTIMLFPLLGVDTLLAKRLYSILDEYRFGCINDIALPQHLKLIQNADARAYDMLQVSVDYLKHYNRVQLIRKLPAHMIIGQLMASQHALSGLEGTKYGLYDSSEFVWCSVCGAVYSMVREIRSSWKKVYLYGLRDAVVDYETDAVYCWRGKTNHLGSCATKPLIRISLYGVVLKYQGKYYMLCPQPTCGMPMVLDTQRCAFTEFGPCCSVCTHKEGSPERMELQRLAELEETVGVCVVCNHKLKTSANRFYYADGVFLCGKHHSTSYANELALRASLKGEPLTPEDTRHLLIEFYMKQRQERRDRHRHTWKRQLERAKLMRSQRRH